MATTEDRIGIFTNVLDRRVIQHLPLADSEILYAGTIAEINGSGELVEFTHTTDDDDSGANLRAVLDHMEEDEGPISNLKSRYPGSDPVDAEVYSGVLMEFETQEGSTAGYSLDQTVYAFDNETVKDDATDTNTGTLPALGKVYSINSSDNTVVVLVEGISA